MYLNFKEFFPNFGIALAIVGVSLGMYLNYFFSLNFFSEIIMLTSLIFICDYKNILSLKFYKTNKMLLVIFLFQVYTLLYVFYSENFDYLLMHYYFMALILCLSTRSFEDINLNKVILYIFVTSFFCSILGVYYLSIGLMVGQEAWEIKNLNAGFALEIFTASYAGCINLMCCIYYIFTGRKNLIFKILFLSIVVLDFYLIFFGGKRSPLLVCLFAIIFFLIASNIKYKLGLLFYSPVVFLLFLCYSFFLNDSLYNKIIEQYENTILGIGALMGFGDIVDKTGSAVYRVTLRDWGFELIQNEFNFLNYIFGYGYMTRWLDNPILQSYIDMGVLGLILYIFVVIIYPMHIYYSIKNMKVVLFFSFCLYSIVTCFNSGNPYLYGKFIPVIILAYVVSVYLNKSKINL